MKTVRIVSKPIAPPWNDASKNIVRTLLAHSEAFAYRFFGTPQSRKLETASIKCDAIFGDSGTFQPSLRDSVRSFAHLALPDPGTALYHYFFSPNPRTSHVLRWLSASKRRPTVHTMCSTPEDPQTARLLFADAVVVLSDHTADSLSKAGVRRVVRIYPGLEPPTVSPDTERLRQDLGLQPGEACVVFSGDYEYSRAHEVILASLPDLMRRCPDAHFVFACRHKTAAAAAIEADAKARVQTLGLSSRVHFLANLQRFPDLLHLASIVVFPVQSLRHKMDIPLTLLEAMALKRPIVVSDLGPLKELVVSANGLKVPPGDAGAFTDAVASLHRDPVARRQMGEVGARVVADTFSAPRMAREYEDLYASLLS